jgi:hypothetical protein
MFLKEANAAPRHRKEITVMGLLSQMACHVCNSVEIEGPIQIVRGLIAVALQNVAILNNIHILG